VPTNCHVPVCMAWERTIEYVDIFQTIPITMSALSLNQRGKGKLISDLAKAPSPPINADTFVR
jgi:hypothetical protein